MPLSSTGSISMSQINTEFGRGYNLNAYRGTTYYTSSGGPFTFSSGAIGFNDFRGTQATASSASNDVTEGVSGNYTGYLSGTMGSISGSGSTLGGRTITGWFYFSIKGTTGVQLHISGDQRGTWWTYGTYRGTTFYRSNTIQSPDTSGNYTSGNGYTLWTIAVSERPSFTGSGTYTLILYP